MKTNEQKKCKPCEEAGVHCAVGLCECPCHTSTPTEKECEDCIKIKANTNPHAVCPKHLKLLLDSSPASKVTENCKETPSSESWVEGLKNLACINYNLYFGSPAKRRDKVDKNGDNVEWTYEEALDELLSFIKNTIIPAEVNKEKLAWLRGERCHTCGKEMKHKDLSDTCKDCWETE